MTLKQRDYILKFLPYILTFEWHHNQVKFSLRDVISISNISETAFHAPLALKWWCHNRRLPLKLKLSAYHSFWLKIDSFSACVTTKQVIYFFWKFSDLVWKQFRTKSQVPKNEKSYSIKTIIGVLTISRHKPYSKFAFIFVSVRLYVQHSGQFCAEMCKTTFPFFVCLLELNCLKLENYFGCWKVLLFVYGFNLLGSCILMYRKILVCKRMV